MYDIVKWLLCVIMVAVAFPLNEKFIVIGVVGNVKLLLLGESRAPVRV